MCESDEDDDKKISAITVLSKSKLEKQLIALEKYRTNKLNCFRHGSAVQNSTFESERGGLLRFLGWYSVTQNVPQPTLELLLDDNFGETAQQYAEWLQTRELRYSTISNYINALIQVAPFACTLVDSDDISIPAHEQLCNLRRQCDKQANEDSLYRRKSENWISWTDVQKCRQNAIQQYNAASSEDKRKMIKQVLIIMFHSCAPPDR